MSEAHAPPKHPYHLVAPSVWPLFGAVAAGLITTGGVLYMHGYGWTLLIIGVLAVLATMAVWWRDVIREATFQGYHTPVVQLGMRYGMALFIASEVMFFAAFFWAFFASSLFPVGGTWSFSGFASLRFRHGNIAMPHSISPTASIHRLFSWRPVFTVFTSSSARLS
jgi:cytochrome c oxidase subunit 3